MAGKPVGTIFVELDLDASRYTKGQQALLKDAQSTTLNIEQNFKNLGIKSSAEMDLMRAKVKNSFDMIANSSKATANDIIRAEEAKNAKLKALNTQQFGEQTSIIDKLKNNWLAGSAAIAAAAVVVHKAMAYIEEGARAMQVESAFKIMADSAGVNSERMIASMKAATRETIDDSQMMQKAIKLMTLGYNPEQIERFSQVVITASQIAGTTAAAAYDELADAIGNRAPKAMVRMGAITREQMGIVNAAIEAGAESIVLYELAMANLELKQKRLQGTQNEVQITFERLNARIGETTETIGKGLIIALDYAYRSFEYLAAGVMGLVSAYARYRELVYMVMGDEQKASDNRFVANVAWETRMDLLKRSTEAITDNAAAGKRATAEEISGAKAKVDAQVAALKATTDAGKTAKVEYDKSAAVNKSFWQEYKRDVEGAFEFEKFKLEEQLKEFDKYVHDKNALNVWYAAEARKISIKEFADTAATQFPADDYDAESMRAKSYGDSMKNAQKNAEEFERANKELWKNSVTYGEDTFAEWDKLTEQTANSMQQNFSNLFFDAMTGKLKTLEDYAKAIFDSIARMVSDMAAQMATEAIFGDLSKGASGKSGGGGLLGSIIGMFGGNGGGYSGGNPYGAGTGDWGAVAHSGGVVGSTSFPQREMPAWMIATAPRLHNGLAADEFPAILQKGEEVTAKKDVGKNGAKGGDTYHIYNISAIDSQSFAEAARRSGAVPALAAENYANNGVLRSVLRGTP
jgi:hypothetical protein